MFCHCTELRTELNSPNTFTLTISFRQPYVALKMETNFDSQHSTWNRSTERSFTFRHRYFWHCDGKRNAKFRRYSCLLLQVECGSETVQWWVLPSFVPSYLDRLNTNPLSKWPTPLDCPILSVWRHRKKRSARSCDVSSLTWRTVSQTQVTCLWSEFIKAQFRAVPKHFVTHGRLLQLCHNANWFQQDKHVIIKAYVLKAVRSFSTGQSEINKTCGFVTLLKACTLRVQEGSKFCHRYKKIHLFIRI